MENKSIIASQSKAAKVAGFMYLIGILKFVS